MEGFTVIAETLQATGPYGLAAIFVWLYFKERTYAQGLNEKILGLAVKSTETASAQSSALASLKEVILAIRDSSKGD